MQYQKLIHLLSDSLLANTPYSDVISQSQCELSLKHLWARFWIDEAHAQWLDDVEIINDWIAHPELGTIGKEAPTGARVYINGAWIDGNGEAYLFSKKKNRSHDIYLYGFS